MARCALLHQRRAVPPVLVVTAVIREGVVSIGGVDLGFGRFVGAVGEAGSAVREFTAAAKGFAPVSFTVRIVEDRPGMAHRQLARLLRSLSRSAAGGESADERQALTRSQQRAAARRRAPWRRS